MLQVSGCSYVALTTWRERAWKLLRDLQNALDQLRASATAALTTVQGRNHLARGIHDGLDHYLTVINVQLEKALAYRDVDRTVTDQAVREARRITTAALEEVSASVGALHDREEVPTLTALAKRLAENLASEQLAIEVRMEGNEKWFARQSLVVLYRAIEEGLTNMQKHAGASRASFEMVFGAEAAQMRLSDDGCGFKQTELDAPEQTPFQAIQEEGYGLQGLRERLELVGGRVEVESRLGAARH